MYDSLIQPSFLQPTPFQHFSADTFPQIHPVRWLHSHFAVGGWSPLQRLSGMLTAHMTRIAPRSGFTWHPHRGLEIFTWVLEGTLHHEDTTGGMGDIGPGELQRMFSGDWIEHQELNQTDAPARVIQIWFAADVQFRGLAPHYQQPRREQFPVQMAGDASVTTLIGADSPMETHIVGGRLTAATLPAGGTAPLTPPRPDEDLFVYFTDGAGQFTDSDPAIGRAIGQYDVSLLTATAPEIPITAGAQPLHWLNIYLPKFLN